MPVTSENEILKGDEAAVMAELSKDIGYTLFSGEGSFLANPDLSNVISGTHEVTRYPVVGGSTTPMVVPIEGPRGEGSI